MFLPVILIRDYGLWGWVIFAIPNMLGAAAMPYVLKETKTSFEITEKHKIACIIFSIITILFQIYFMGWVSTLIPPVFTLAALITLFLIIYIPKKISNQNQLLSAFIIWVLSAMCFIWALNVVPVEEMSFLKNLNLIHNTKAVLCLAPICIFGFLLCPYLDLTFHKARQSNTLLNSKIAFTTGFCFLFLIMILFTYFYAKPMTNIIESIPYFLKDQKPLPQIFVYIVVFHFLIQAGFTSFLHLKAVFSITKRQIKIDPLFLITAMIVYFLPIVFNKNYTFLDLSINESIYRSFMAFYGLIVPAYVFLFLIPKNKKNIPLNRNNIFILLITVLFALPFYTLGFLGKKWGLEVWLIPGLIITLCSRFFIRQGNIDS